MAKVLVLVKLPPPITGASLMNKVALECLADHTDVRLVNLSYGSSVKELGEYSPFKLIRTWRNYFRIFTSLVKERFDFVYFQISPTGLAFVRDAIVVAICRLFSQRMLFHLHGKGIRKDAERSVLFRWLQRFVYRESNLILVSNKLSFDAEHLSAKRVFVLPNTLVDRVRSSRVVSHGSIVHFSYLSNLKQSKGLFILLDACVALSERGVSFRLSIAGQESTVSEAQLHREIELRNLSSVVSYQGPLFGAEKFEFLASSDCFVFPTLNDIWGVVILEAMSVGLPVIASNEGAITDMVHHERNGLVVDKNDVTSLSEAMLFLAEHPDIRERYGHASQEIFSHQFTREIFASRLRAIVDDLLINETTHSTA